jgi:DNA polymerase I-like protein with 3'-5' exonuclease and polymerase domains
MAELSRVQPEYIIAVGRFASRFFLGDEIKMDVVHGRPFHMTDSIVIPVFHVAAGLHDPSRMIQVQADFADAASIIKGHFKPIKDEYGENVLYRHLERSDQLRNILKDKKLIAVDTETYPDGSPYCLTFSVQPGIAYMIKAGQHELLHILGSVISAPEVTTVLHNALFDLPVLSQMGVSPHPAGVRDTMVMAYLKQGEPQGLKPLAYRWCGMEMMSYEEAVGDATKIKALAYLSTVIQSDWPDPAPVVERVKGTTRTRQPQNIKKKALRIFTDTWNNHVDPYARWQKIEPEEREDVEELLGPMPVGSLADADPQRALEYACRDADATIRLAPQLWTVMEERDLTETFEIDMAVIPMALDMMLTGIKVNIPYLMGLSLAFQQKLDLTEAKITALTGKEINPQAHDQVAELLFNHLGMKSIKKTKGGKQSTAEEVLARLVNSDNEHHNKVVQLVRDCRKLSKLKGTYTDTLPKQAREDGRVHGTIRLTRTATGRLSMANPNLQNQPVRTEEGRWIRKGFIASDGCSLVSSDYSQIELRMMAHESEDTLMLQIFKNGEDIHAITASQMFGVEVDKLDKMAHRYPAKRTNFGIAYDITAQGLYRDFQIAGAKGWTVDKCQELIDEWFKLYRGVWNWKRQISEFARLNGYVTDMFGRRRYCPAVRSATPYLREKALREAGNMPIQAGAQGVIKVAMGKLVPVITRFREEGYIINPLVQIHDDLLFEVEDRGIDYIVPVIQEVMENAVELSVPTPVDPEVGKNWAEMKKWRKAA